MTRAMFWVAVLSWLSGIAPAISGNSFSIEPWTSVTREMGGERIATVWWPERGACDLMLVIEPATDRSDSFAPAADPTRISLRVAPSQLTTVDTPDGSSASFTCGEGAGSLAINIEPARNGLAAE